MSNFDVNRLEVLAPAGDMERFRAAIDFGADAVYLGASQFNARMRAENFTKDNIRDFIKSVKSFIRSLLTFIKR